MVKPRDAALAQLARDEARVALRIERRLKPGEPDNFGIVASDSVLGIFQQATAGIAVVLVGIVGLSLLVGGIVIMNIMLMVVSERTREIGLRKALGAKRRDIMSQVLTESITLSLVGGIVGIALGALFSMIISPLTPVPSSVELWSVVLGVVITAARRAVFRLDPGAPRGDAGSDRSAAAGITVAAFTKQFALLRETAEMALDTLRGNKMRSALTVLGVVIGVTSIVGMTSLIRGFDSRCATRSTRSARRRSSCSGSARCSFSSGRVVHGADAPAANLTSTTGRRSGGCRRRSAWSTSGSAAAARPQADRAGVLSRRAHPAGAGHGHDRALRRHQLREDARRPHRSPSRKCSARRAVAVIGYGPYEALFEKRGIDPIGKRCASAPSSTRSSASSASGRAGRLRPRRRRLRDHSVHGVPPAVRQREGPARAVRRHAAHDRRRARTKA